MIFIDSNIPMYLVGAAHRHKIDAQRLLETAIAAGERLVTDAEVFHEILHRYCAIGRRDAIQPAFTALASVVDDVLPIRDRDVFDAKDIALGSPVLSARDAIHVATMESAGIRLILSADNHFDAVSQVERIAPDRFAGIA